MLLLLTAVSPSLSRELRPITWYVVFHCTFTCRTHKWIIEPVIPSSDAILAPNTFLILCLVTPILNLFTRWRLPNGAVMEILDGSVLLLLRTLISMIQHWIPFCSFKMSHNYEDAGTYTYIVSHPARPGQRAVILKHESEGLHLGSKLHSIVRDWAHTRRAANHTSANIESTHTFLRFPVVGFRLRKGAEDQKLGVYVSCLWVFRHDHNNNRYQV